MSRCRSWWFRLGVCAAVVLFPGSAAVAQVLQVEGGGSTLTDGIGGALSVWSNRFEGGVGIGYLDGLRISLFAKGALSKTDTLRLGNDYVPVVFPTDVFGGSNALLVQGASLRRVTESTRAFVFAGASAQPLASPSLVPAMRGDRALGIVQVEHALSATTTLDLHAIVSDRQTLLPGIRWVRPSAGLELGATGGIGANDPYAAASMTWEQRRFDLRASWVEQGSSFRRAGVAMPSQAEPDRENVLLTLRPATGFSFGVGRQHFRQDSVLPGTPERATLNQLFANAELFDARVGAGLFDSQAGGIRNVSGYVNARRDITDWLEAEIYLLRLQAPREIRTTTPILRLREYLTPRLTLLQVASFTPGHNSVSFGGSYTSGLMSLGLDYQVVHTPFRPTDPFVQSAAVSARVQLRDYQVNLSSFVTPDGKVRYTASASTYLYLGDAIGRGNRVREVRFERYLVAGRVVDEGGSPIDGAALEIGDNLVFTNGSGSFFVRVGDDDPLPVRVLHDEFLVPGRFEVVRAPSVATPAREGKATPIVIVLRRMRISTGSER